MINFKHNPNAKKICLDSIRFLGNKEDGAIEGVCLTEDGLAFEIGYYFGEQKNKNILDVSSQIGCTQKCKFCELGSERFRRNLTRDEIYQQVAILIDIVERRGFVVKGDNHKVDFGKSGEPLLNNEVPESIENISSLGFSFKLCTILPKADRVWRNFEKISRFASGYDKSFQVQVSLISTSERYREEVSGSRLFSFEDIRKIGEQWKQNNPWGRKINLSIILSRETPCNMGNIRNVLTPEYFNIRLRNYVPTVNGSLNNLMIKEDRDIERLKDEFRNGGYFVIDDARPTKTEFRYSLASNVTLKRYIQSKKREISD